RERYGGGRGRGGRRDQPRTQLDQVMHQGRLGGLDFLFFVFASHRALPSPSGEDGSVAASGATGPTPAPTISLSRSSAAASGMGSSLAGEAAAGLSGSVS